MTAHNDLLNQPDQPVPALNRTASWLVLTAAFLGWMFAGWQLAITQLAMREAASSLLVSASEQTIAAWYGRLTVAFLLGAAFGGYVLGWVGDRYGRARAMACSILFYSVFSAAAVYVEQPWQLWIVRFVCCMGVGGMWPNGIALVSEVWPGMSRPILAGAIGTSANLGIMILSAIARERAITVQDWHWVMWLGASPAILGALVWLLVPESPQWKALNSSGPKQSTAEPVGLGDVFKPPILQITLLGIALGTIPLFGGWGNSNWVMPWASQVGEQIGDPRLKADLSLARSLPGTISSLLGGGLAVLLGRRRSYFLLSLGSLISAEILFCFLTPDGQRWWFVFWFAVLGLCSGFFFGWLPLCLPELFPTRVRSTGAGISFNWGRIVTAAGVIFASEMHSLFEGNYAMIGRLTSLIYVAGMIVIFFMPDTSGENIANTDLQKPEQPRTL